MATLTAADVKAKARELGADLCNVVACATLEVNPPDPRWPQVPSRISKRMKSCIVTAIRMPWGMLLTENSTCLSLAAQLLLRKTEKVSLELAYWLERCTPYSSPYGYHFVQQHMARILEVADPAQRMERVQGMDTFMIWQSMLRGVGVYTGCTRCYDVCPAGADYAAHLREVQERIPEETPAKRERLAAQQRPEARAASSTLRLHARWIGELPSFD